MSHSPERGPESEELLDEFKRIKAYAATNQGYEEINDAWMRSMNYYKGSDGQWYKVDIKGGDVAGFAIDPVTWDYEIGQKGRNHDMPRMDLYHRLTEKPEDFLEHDEEIRRRIVEGRIAEIDGWKYPLVYVIGFPSEPIQKIESKILELKIGLPLRGIRDARMKDEEKK